MNDPNTTQPTVESLRIGFPDLVRRIEEEAVSKATTPLTEKVNTLTESLEAAKAKIEGFEADAAAKAVAESVRKLVQERATLLQLPVTALTEDRLVRVMPFLTGLAESVRTAEVDALIEDWKKGAVVGGSGVQHLGTRPDLTNTPANVVVEEGVVADKPDGYIPDPSLKAAKV